MRTKYFILLIATFLARAASAYGGDLTNSAPTPSKASRAIYLRQVQSAYMQAWEAPTRPKDVKKAAKVSVVVAKNGSVLSWKITDTSGDEELDSSVRKVLENVKSVQPFEDGARDKRRTVNVTFKLNS